MSNSAPGGPGHEGDPDRRPGRVQARNREALPMTTKNSVSIVVTNRPEVAPANTKIAWEQTNRLWTQAAEIHSEAMLKGDITTVEEAEEHMLRVASVFLLSHGKGDAPLPGPVATWLHAILEDARSGFAIPGLRQRASGRMPGEMGKHARQTAVAYVEAAREGLIEDDAPVNSVARCYQVHIRNVEKWLSTHQAHPGLALILREREWGLAERTAWAKRSLAMHGTYYGLKNRKTK